MEANEKLYQLLISAAARTKAEKNQITIEIDRKNRAIDIDDTEGVDELTAMDLTFAALTLLEKDYGPIEAGNLIIKCIESYKQINQVF